MAPCPSQLCLEVAFAVRSALKYGVLTSLFFTLQLKMKKKASLFLGVCYFGDLGFGFYILKKKKKVSGFRDLRFIHMYLCICQSFSREKE